MTDGNRIQMIEPRRYEAPRRPARGFTLVELAIVALIAGTSMVYLLSLGQANVQMSRVNEESLLARQIALDVVDYFAHNLAQAKLASRSAPQPRDFYLRHPAFRGAFGLSRQTDELYARMDPEITFKMQKNVEFPPGSGNRHAGLHCLTCRVSWLEGGKKDRQADVAASRLVGETP